MRMRIEWRVRIRLMRFAMSRLNEHLKPRRMVGVAASALTIALWPVAALVFLAYFIADGEIRPATASGAAVRRRALRLCLKLLGRADGAMLVGGG